MATRLFIKRLKDIALLQGKRIHPMLVFSELYFIKIYLKVENIEYKGDGAFSESSRYYLDCTSCPYHIAIPSRSDDFGTSSMVMGEDNDNSKQTNCPECSSPLQLCIIFI